MNLRRALAKNVRGWRIEHKLSQEEFADMVDLHRTYISQIEREVKSPTIDVLQRLAIAMKVSASDLLEE